MAEETETREVDEWVEGWCSQDGCAHVITFHHYCMNEHQDWSEDYLLDGRKSFSSDHGCANGGWLDR